MKKNGFKRILAGVLAFAMVFTNLSLPGVYAEENLKTETEIQTVIEESAETETSDLTIDSENAAETSEISEASNVAEEIVMDVPEEGQSDAVAFSADKGNAFDFGAAVLDESVYNNILTADVINSWYAGVEPGSTGKNIASFEVKDPAGNTLLAFNDGGYATTHRLRSTNTALTRYDDKALKDSADAESAAYTGYIYSNKGKTDAVYLALTCEANDIVKVYAASNGTDSEIVFESASGNKQSAVHKLGSSVAGEYTFYAAEAGVYKIYSATEKLVVARILVNHCPAVSVSGNVNAPSGLADYSLVFTNNSTGSVSKAAVVDGQYSISLASNYSYTVSLENANGYIVAAGETLTVGKEAASHDITVAGVSLVTVTGELMGDMTDEAFAKAVISLKAADPEKIYVPSIEWSGRNFTVKLERGVKYDVIVEGVDDYESQINEISADEDGLRDLCITLKDRWEVTIDPVGASLSDLADAEFTFIRHSDADATKEEAYCYSFKGTEGIALRNGVYTVKVKATDYAQKLTSNLVVKDEAVTKTIKFDFTGDPSTPVSWSFTGDDYTGQASYEGLAISGGSKHSSSYGMMIKNGTIEIPVKGASRIDVNVGYTWDISLNDGEAVVQTTNGGNQTVSFDYNGAAGVATLKAGANATSYIAGITVTPVSESSEPEVAVTSWDFGSDAYTGQSTYDGLIISGGSKHSANYGMMIKNGKITVPVSAAATLKITVGYTWDVSVNGSEAEVQTSDGGSKVLSYDIASKGNVEITFGSNATSYVKAIKVELNEQPATEDIKITVGAAGCDYTTVNDALAAVRKMKRADGQRAVIEIQPGNYEEMLVIDVPNVSLVNANANPSIKPVNKGVDIEASSVRITSYYGHGYTYYSMDSNCKYDEELLAVNKENGYASFINPGSGTTNNSYWNATVTVRAEGFVAEGIIFENSFNQYVSEKAANDVIVAQSSAKEGSVKRAEMKAGDTTVQNKKYVERAAALAITNNVEKASFDNCAFIGRQDTLYGGTNTTAAFYACDIYGGTDYIFGGMTAVFAKCNLVANTMEDSNDMFYITAAQQKSGRGYLMFNCNVTSTEPGVNTASESVSKAGDFGRPWEANTSEVVFYATNVGESTEEGVSLIRPAGWNATLSSTSDNVYEFGTNEMSGADNLASRVSWAHTFASIEGATLSDGTKVSVEAFLGNWDAFAGKDMTIVVADKIEHPVVEPEVPEGETTVSNTYVLNAADHDAFAAGAKKDGEEEKLGTDNYFTVIYSAKSKVDSSNKTFEDGFASSTRFNLGGLVSTEKNAVKFTTSHKNAVVKVWWVEGGDDNRQMAVLNSNGETVVKTDVKIAKNATCISTFTLEDAGTYYLGGDINNNYIFKVEVTETVSYVLVEHEYVLDAAADLTAFAAGAKKDGDEEKAGTDNYFTNIYSAKSKVDSSNKTFEDGYTSAQRINFGGLVSLEKNAVKFTTTSENAVVKVWWVEGGDDNRQMAVLNSKGETVAKTDVKIAKNAVCISTFEIANAGTYYLGGATNNNYIFKVQVTEKKLEAVDGEIVTPVRKAWSDVAAPVVASAVQAGGAVVVTVNALVGSEGADYIEVSAMNAAGDVLETRKSSKEGESVEISFTLNASGTYSFAVSAYREDETEVHTSEAVSAEFVLPLVAPSVKSATNVGEGKVDVSWDAVSEATGYIVLANGQEVATSAALRTTVDLSAFIGESVKLSVKAVRGEETSEAGAEFAVTVKNNSEREWGFVAYGPSVSLSKDGFSGSVNDGSVSIYSTGNGGKIVPNTSDGLAFYYTVIDPEEENFTLEADITVDSWTFSNGQEGFGMMVADSIGNNGDGSTHWNNSVMNIVSKVEYDTEAGSKITMKLGVGALVRLGVSGEDFRSIKETGSFPGGVTLPANFTSATYTLDRRAEKLGAGTYNIVGNCTNTPDNTISEITTFHMSIQRNNTGYIVKYCDENGNVIGEHLVYDIERDALTQIDEDHIYLGFFAARNASITVNNVKLTTINPADDEAAEEHEIEYVNPVYTVESSSTSNTADYQLVFYSNADGLLTVKAADGSFIAKDVAVKAAGKAYIDTVLENGETYFDFVFTPDENYKPGEYKELSSYEAVTIRHYVTYSSTAIGEGKYIYVSPNGNGNGTYTSPASIYAAVKYVKPGQTIVLAGGTYKLNRSFNIERGTNGTKDEPIYMISNPNDSERAVFDLQGKYSGVIFGGDYWYFKGFDLTGSSDGSKGIQVSGSYNTLDDIRTYKNGNTGIQISRYLPTDSNNQWPSYNLILNCTSFLNADSGYEDADGFAAKLTIGEGNVFDGCIAAFNADDGWDLFAKAETGPIGTVVIKNSVAFMNGYVFDSNGKLINAGNGNGFKLGGSSLTGKHTLINSVAFANKAKGIDSNSCPDIQAYSCVTFDNGSYNVAFYTNDAVNTNFIAANIVSYNVTSTVAEQLKLKGTQNEADVKNSTNYFVGDGNVSSNTDGVKVTADWFENMNVDAVVADAISEMLAGNFGYTTTHNGVGVERNADGSINMNGFLALTDKAPEKAGADLTEGATVTLPDGTVVTYGNDSKTFDDVTKASYVAPAASDSTPSSSGSTPSTSQPSESGSDNSGSQNAAETPAVNAPVNERPGAISTDPSENETEETKEETVTENKEETKTETVTDNTESTDTKQEVTNPAENQTPVTTEVPEAETPLSPAPEKTSNAATVVVIAVLAALAAASGLFFLLKKKFLLKK